jgi:hypothetical protein
LLLLEREDKNNAETESQPVTKDRHDIKRAFVARIVAIGQDVHHNSRPGVNFPKYHTSKWVNIEGGAHPNQIVYSLTSNTDDFLPIRS